MICGPCKNSQHNDCPNQVGEYYETWLPANPGRIRWTKHPTGLSKPTEANQRAGLCPCQHKGS